MVRVTNSDNQITTKSINVTTESIAAPAYTDIKTDSGRDVTIDFGVDCSNSTYTCSYQKDNGTFVTTKNTKQIVSFTSDGTLVAKITSGTNDISSSYNVQISDTKTGWQYENGNYYYYDASGNKKTGWLNTAETPGNSGLGCTSQWYYLESDGKMATGWYKVGNSWYYLAKQDGKENKWNTAQTKGCMYTGWVYSEDYSNCASHGWYFDSSGAMVSNTTINGSTINSSGCWVS